MGRVRFAAFLALVMVAAALVVAAPPLVSTASAQATACTAGTFVELDACVVLYNGAPAGTSNLISIDADITFTAMLTSISNTTVATLEIDGNGFTLDVDSATSGAGDGIVVQAGDLSLHHVTITGANLNPGSDGLAVVGSASAHVSATTFTGNTRGLFAGSTIDAVVTNSTVVDTPTE